MTLFILGESGWESNPPRPATRPATGFEDQEAHRDLTTPSYSVLHESRMNTRKQGCGRMPAPLFSGLSQSSRDRLILNKRKDNRMTKALQASLSVRLKLVLNWIFWMPMGRAKTPLFTRPVFGWNYSTRKTHHA